ncbi:MAG: pilus assembly protein TadG-related protein [Candidatus Wallbacteria bacterium]|nr:pilus assembly protein TadG-related protein [Candidatus Wallbacteria bacterium]
MKSDRRTRQGISMVIVSVSMILVMGMAALAIDVGNMYLEQSTLDKATKLAALGAAQAMKQTDDPEVIESQALSIFAGNGMDPSQAEINIQVTNGTETAFVNASLQVPFYFAKVLGFESIDLNSQALAELQPNGSSKLIDQQTNDLVPWGIPNGRTWFDDNEQELNIDSNYYYEWSETAGFEFSIGDEYLLKLGDGQVTDPLGRKILITMDGTDDSYPSDANDPMFPEIGTRIQAEFLKAYGLIFWCLQQGIHVDWILDYNGGSFLIDYRDEVASAVSETGVDFNSITKYTLSSKNVSDLLEWLNSHSSSEGRPYVVVPMDDSFDVAVFTQNRYLPPDLMPWGIKSRSATYPFGYQFEQEMTFYYGSLAATADTGGWCCLNMGGIVNSADHYDKTLDGMPVDAGKVYFTGGNTTTQAANYAHATVNALAERMNSGRHYVKLPIVSGFSTSAAVGVQFNGFLNLRLLGAEVTNTLRDIYYVVVNDETNTVKFEDASLDGADFGLGEDGEMHMDTFIITAVNASFPITGHTKAGGGEWNFSLAGVGSSFTDAGGFTTTLTAADGDTYTFTIVSDTSAATAALSHATFILGPAAEIRAPQNEVTIIRSIPSLLIRGKFVRKVPPADLQFTVSEDLPDEVVTKALSQAGIPFSWLHDADALDNTIDDYEWIYTHHEDFYDTAVAERLAHWTSGGRYFFNMCWATDRFDNAIEEYNHETFGSDTSQYLPKMFFKSYADPQIYRCYRCAGWNEDSDCCFYDGWIYEFVKHTDINNTTDSSYTINPRDIMINQNHVSTIPMDNYEGRTHAFAVGQLMTDQQVFAKDNPSVGYREGVAAYNNSSVARMVTRSYRINGSDPGGVATFYGGHDPCHSSENLPAYRLILNNVLAGSQVPAVKTANDLTNFGALDLDATQEEGDSKEYLANIKCGYQNFLYPGKIVHTLPNNLPVETNAGVAFNVSGNPGTWDSHTTDSPRVVLVPVVDTMNADGTTVCSLEQANVDDPPNCIYGIYLRDKVRIRGIAKFWLLDVATANPDELDNSLGPVENGQVRGIFLGYFIPPVE